MEGLSDAEARQAHQALADLTERRLELRDEAESAVQRWQWAAENSNAHRPEPLYHERYGLPRPKLLDEAPASPTTETPRRCG